MSASSKEGRGRGPGLSLLVLLVMVALFPAVASDYETNLLAKFLAFAVLALSLDLIWGYAGVVNFGHAIFFGVGAYSMGLVLKHVPVPGATYLAMLAAIAVPLLLGLGLGLFLFYGRVGGVYFGVVTLALTGVVQQLIIASNEMTGGMNGLYGYGEPKIGIPGLWEVGLYEADAAYYTILVGMFGCYLLARWLVASDFGRAIQGIKENEARIEYLGYDVPLLKLTIFSISCAMAGFSGALYVPVGFISPDLVSLGMSAAVLVWVAVGGRGTLIGALLGAVLVNYLQTLLSDALVVLWLLIVGLFFITVVLFWPGGLVGLLRSPWMRRHLPFLRV